MTIRIPITFVEVDTDEIKQCVECNESIYLHSFVMKLGKTETKHYLCANCVEQWSNKAEKE